MQIFSLADSGGISMPSAPTLPTGVAAGSKSFVASPVTKRSLGTKWPLFLLILIVAGGSMIRMHRLGTRPESFDAQLYHHYLNLLIESGPTSYPDIVEYYISSQQQIEGAILPPTRALYILCGYGWHGVFGTNAMTSLRDVSCASGILMLVLTAVWVWRMAGPRFSLGVTALMTTSPVAIHMSEHVLIDGFFALWATLVLWSLWECLRSPNHSGWQALYTLSGALLVLTKENSFFVFVGVAGLLALNWKVRFGTITLPLLLLTVAGPLLGGVTLLFLSGGLANLIDVYRLLVTKAYTLEYAIRFCDGPWHRYLIDLLLVNPLTMLLAIGGVFALRLKDKPALYLVGFFAVTYLIMCNVKYGMNLRYATIWDLPIRYLAFSQLTACAWRIGGRRYASWVVVSGVLILCAYDLRQWCVFFVDHHLLELISEDLLRAVSIIKGYGKFQ